MPHYRHTEMPFGEQIKRTPQLFEFAVADDLPSHAFESVRTNSVRFWEGVISREVHERLGAPHGTGHGITGQMAESSRACIRRPRAVSKEVVDGGMGGYSAITQIRTLLNCFSAANMVRARINGVPFVPDAPVRLHPDQKGGGGTKIRLYGTPEPRPRRYVAGILLSTWCLKVDQSRKLPALEGREDLECVIGNDCICGWGEVGRQNWQVRGKVWRALRFGSTLEWNRGLVSRRQPRVWNTQLDHVLWAGGARATVHVTHTGSNTAVWRFDPRDFSETIMYMTCSLRQEAYLVFFFIEKATARVDMRSNSVRGGGPTDRSDTHTPKRHATGLWISEGVWRLYTLLDAHTIWIWVT
ncbi:hypothetical protein F5J12DRAFT_961694 [Pisolithus orientalis]|uniref:uncharacterized protein n=1 Tax=Pisolithus orientalis TaxID=936130 RepID=UPI0022253AF0|nr:uncharacterized protein F5J12DRAFT_961694 [Pisolithus orientalis]KAI5995272.1 hypothetical protein F5J12DRAFT_961694 [Pisolithus orientalis]